MNLTKNKILAQIAEIRTNAAVFLIDTAQLKRRTGVTYVNGEAKPVYGTPETFSCRLITRSGSESNNIAAQPRGIEQSIFTGLFRMQIPYTLDVSEGDLILYTDLTTGDIRTFDVVFSPPKHEYAGAVIIQLQEVK